MAWDLILFLACFVYNTQSLLLPLGWVTKKNMQKKSSKICIPTTTSRSPCVICICNPDGVYICRSDKCTEKTELRTDTSECQSYVRYIKDYTVCTCSDNGRWLSENCRKILKTLDDQPMIHRNLRSNITSKPNRLYLIDCNVCKSDKKGLISAESCTSRYCKAGNKGDVCRFGNYLRTEREFCLCSDVNYYVDKLCMKLNQNALQEISIANAKVLTDVGFKANKKCAAFREYYIDCNHCVCDESGKLICTKKDCTPKKNYRKAETNLATVRSLHDRCVKGKRYKYKCNVCVCMADKELSCTKEICTEDFIIDGLAVQRGLISVND